MNSVTHSQWYRPAMYWNTSCRQRIELCNLYLDRTVRFVIDSQEYWPDVEWRWDMVPLDVLQVHDDSSLSHSDRGTERQIKQEHYSLLTAVELRSSWEESTRRTLRLVRPVSCSVVKVQNLDFSCSSLDIPCNVQSSDFTGDNDGTSVLTNETGQVFVK